MPSLEELIAHSHRARTKANRSLQPLRSWVVRVATKIGVAALRSQPWRQAFPHQPRNRRRRCALAQTLQRRDAVLSLPVLKELLAHSRRARTKANRPLQPLRRSVSPAVIKIGIAAPIATMAPSVSAPTAPLTPTMRAGSNVPASGRCSVSARRRKNAARSVMSLIPRSRANTAGVCPLGWAIRGGRSDNIVRGRVSRSRNATRKPADADLGLPRAAASSPVLW